MVAIPGGTFLMGSPPNEKDSFEDERPQHEVTVSNFFMGKYPITQAQWRAVASRKDLKVEKDLDPDPSHFKDRGGSSTPRDSDHGQSIVLSFFLVANFRKVFIVKIGFNRFSLDNLACFINQYCFCGKKKKVFIVGNNSGYFVY
ncbi:MAG: formylglycine-generating enzyme family protein [Microcystis panniformis]